MSQAALFFSHKAYPFPPTLSDRSNREDGFPGWVAESRDEGDGARNPSAKKRKETSLSRHTRAMRAVKLTRQYDCVIRAKHVTRIDSFGKKRVSRRVKALRTPRCRRREMKARAEGGSDPIRRMNTQGRESL